MQSRHVTALGQDETDHEIDRYGVLRTPPRRELQALVELAAVICGVPTAAINIITASQQHQVAATGMEPSVCTRSDSMCAAVLAERRTVVVPDATEDHRFRDNPFVTGRLGAVRFYASAPLVTRGGVPLGRLCVFDDAPRDLDQEQRKALTVVAERIVDVLELRLRTDELEQSLRELTRTRDELHRSNELLTKFAGQVSHDLRTPLTAMMLNAEMVVEDPAVSGELQLRQPLDAVLAAGRRMSRLIDDLLDFAMVGADLKVEDVDLDVLVAEVVADLGPALEDAGARVEVGSVLGKVRADRQQLYSVLLNLLTNAVKFSREGTTPRIGVTAVTDDGGVRVEVSDNGPGIAADRQDGVFELFSRADRSVPGSGIGLATVRAAVEAHGGTVGLESVEEAGTTFWFTLPSSGQHLTERAPR